MTAKFTELKENIISVLELIQHLLPSGLPGVFSQLEEDKVRNSEWHILANPIVAVT